MSTSISPQHFSTAYKAPRKTHDKITADISVPMPKPERRNATERIGTIGEVFVLLSGAGLLLSPLLAKKTAGLNASSAFKHLPFTKHLLPHLQNAISDRKNIEQFFWRSFSASSLLLGMNNYQTAKNTKQPSLLLNNLIGYIFGIALFIRPQSISLRSTVFLNWAFLAMGKRNDIDNGNHPTKRREWDIQRLEKAYRTSNKTFLNELRSFSAFIAEDFKKTFSFKPWQKLAHRFKDKKEWARPQSYQISISGQLFALGFLTTILAERFKIRNITPYLVTTGGIIYNLPFFVRAWQNRHEIENKAMMASIPISIVGDAFRVAPANLSFLSGLSTTSGITTKSVEINSRRYRALLDYLDQLFHFAQKHPAITAQDIFMELQGHQWRLSQIQHQLGKNRTNILLRILHDASLAERTQGTPLAAYLEPIVLPNAHRQHLATRLPPLA